MCRAAALVLVLFVLLAPSASEAACGACTAEQVTAATASKLLFGGTDAAGGVDDWYLSNGKIQAIIDDIGPTETGVSGVTVDKTSSNAVETGGTLLDLGLNGKNNDQLPQSFNVGGLSLANVFIFRQGDETHWPGAAGGGNPCTSVGAANTHCPADPDCAAITTYGIMLGTCTSPTDLCSTRSAPKLFVRTIYEACNGETTLRLRTDVWNQTGNTQSLPVFDIFLWGGRGISAFAPDRGRGFTHPVLDLGSVASILSSLSSAPFFAAPGNNDKTDGVSFRGKPADAVSYGYRSLGASLDSNGGEEGGTLTVAVEPDQLQSLQSGLVSAATASLGITVPNGQSVVYTRRLIVSNRNDAASVLGDAKNPESILGQTGLPIGTVSGKVSPGSTQLGTFTFTRTGGSDLSSFGAGFAALNSAVLTEVRTKASFSKVQLPEGTYALRAVFPGRDDVLVSGITVTAGKNTAIPPIALPKPGKLQIEVRDADTNKGIPAKISLSPSPDMRREFPAFTFDVRSGMCSNNASVTCADDAACGGGNTCFRTCTNVEPQPCGTGCPTGFTCASDGKCRRHSCSSDADCDPGYLCKADTTNALPESYPGGFAQVQAMYTDKKGKVQAEVKPGTYTVSVSRGIEYTITKLDNVAITAGGTAKLGRVTLKHVVDTTGYLSADFHIHSGRSFDSSVPLSPRVASFAGEGVEVLVSTDHDMNTDYAPTIKKMGLNGFIASIIGTEVTTSVSRPPYLSNGWGHINGWPCIFDSTARRSGAIEDESVSANVIYDRLRAQSNQQCVGGTANGKDCSTDSACPGGTCTDVGEQVVQMNHPRSSVAGTVNIGMYDNIGYDPSKSITSCQKYPVLCPTSQCAGGTNDGTSCTSDASCTGGGKCGCIGASVPATANGCNDIMNDLNVVPQATRCTTPGCGSGFENLTGTRNIDFDIMEIQNASKVTDLGFARRMRRDWLSFLNQGLLVGAAGSRHPMWGTGVSDSHRLHLELAGYARTFVGAGEFPAKTLDIKAFNQQVLAGNMTVSAGPYITFNATKDSVSAGVGQTLSGTGAVDLKIKVQAAPWVPVDEVRVIKNGCVVQCFNGTTSPAVTPRPADAYEQSAANVVRFDATWSDTVAGDSYYIVEASPNMPPAGTVPAVDPVVDSVAPKNFPWALTNPIFVDADGGGYTGIALPAGAGEPTCPALPASCSTGAVIAAATATPPHASKPATGPGALLAYLQNLFVRPATARDDAPQADSEEQRLQEHEREIRKSSQEYYPRHLVVFPTPRPEDIRPRPQAPTNP